MHCAPQVLVQAFLQQAQDLVRVGSKHRLFSRRPENIATLTQLGLLERHVFEIILDLKTVHYVGNVDATDDHPEGCWVFGVMVNGHEIYLKLKIRSTPRGEVTICVSFHPPIHPLQYPYQ